MSAALIVLAGLAGWEAIVRLGLVDELILPAPTQVADSLWTDRALLAPDLATTTWEVLLGLAAAIAAAVAVIGAVFAEWAGSSDGLGHELLTANGQLETARAFAATLLLFLLAVALYGAFALLERRVVDWAPRSAPGGP